MTTATRARVRRALAVVVALGSGLVTTAGDLPASVVTGGTAGLGAAPFSELVASGGVVTATTAHVTFAGELFLAADDASVAGVRAREVLMDDDDASASGILLTRVEVLVDGDEGTLVADVTARAGPDSEAISGVELGAIDLTERPLTVADGAASVDGAPVMLTEDGAPSVGGEPGDSLGQLTLSLELAPPALDTLQLQDAVAHAGEDAHFAVVATDLPELAVRWQTRPHPAAEWDVSDTTGPALTLPAVTVAQDGTQVRAVVGPDAEPDAVSDVATLTVPAPTVEVVAADGVTPLAAVRDGDTVVVTGTGFGPAANVGGTHGPVPGHLPQGIVVALGAFAEHWRPSADAPADSRTSVTEVRVLAEDVRVQVPAPEQDGAGEQWVALTPDGTFTAELVLITPAGGWPPDGAPGIYTYAAGGVTNADQELGVPLELLAPVPELAPLATVPPLVAERPDAEDRGAATVPPPEPGPDDDLPEWPSALRPDAPSVPSGPDAAVATPDEAAGEEPAATTAEGVSTLVMLVVVVLLAGALITGTRERG